jgi:ubiquinol-cytochrome c reductase cytochrome c1 subunit
MKNVILTVLMLCAVSPLWAAGAHITLDKVDINLQNTASLQRGAAVFLNNCTGCHSAQFMRYSRIAKDLKIPPEIIQSNYLTGDMKIGDSIVSSMGKSYAKEVFGVVPPDLSLTARSRGPDWIYSYLRAFYEDPSRPWGVNNKVFPNVGMPHVLRSFQGIQRPVYALHDDGHGHADKVLVGLELKEGGSQTPVEYDLMIRDLVNFMTYMAEPSRIDRQNIGLWVLLYLSLLLVLVYILKKEYWKDIH